MQGSLGNPDDHYLSGMEEYVKTLVNDFNSVIAIQGQNISLIDFIPQLNWLIGA